MLVDDLPAMLRIALQAGWLYFPRNPLSSPVILNRLISPIIISGFSDPDSSGANFCPLCCPTNHSCSLPSERIFTTIRNNTLCSFFCCYYMISMITYHYECKTDYDNREKKTSLQIDGYGKRATFYHWFSDKDTSPMW